MGTKMIRSSYSNIVREAQDASAALFDREGNVIAQAELIPMQLGPMSEIFRACAAVHPVHTLKEGDFYINNDPYGGGQHLQDVFIYSPIFYDGMLVAFAGTTAHHLDLGGGNPGLTPDAVDVHAEGIIFPPSVYNYQRDWCDGPLERLVAANIRVPSQTIGDFYAQFAANSIGAQRIRQLCDKYGATTISRGAAGDPGRHLLWRGACRRRWLDPRSAYRAGCRYDLRRHDLRRLHRHRRPGPPQSQLPMGFDDLGDTFGREIRADQP
jgi:N-methylhydantoinase B